MRSQLLILCLLGLAWAAMPAAGQDEPAKKAKKEIPAVAKVLKKAKFFIKDFGMRFPAIMDTDDKKRVELPGYERGPGVPWAVVVDAQGNMLRSGQASLVNNWGKIVRQAEEKAAESTEEE